MKTTTTPTSAPTWYVVDATGQTLGDLASKVAHVLRGKHKPTFSPHQLCGDVVVVINSDKLNVPPTKTNRKFYFTYTGYPGSMRKQNIKEMMETKSDRVIEMAVRGMLPRNRLREAMLHRLHVSKDAIHKYVAQKPTPLDLTTLL
jgi:large subunit ribosomal protein L13